VGFTRAPQNAQSRAGDSMDHPKRRLRWICGPEYGRIPTKRRPRMRRTQRWKAPRGRLRRESRVEACRYSLGADFRLRGRLQMPPVAAAEMVKRTNDWVCLIHSRQVWLNNVLQRCEEATARPRS
jgi:hypothetical protein